MSVQSGKEKHMPATVQWPGIHGQPSFPVVTQQIELLLKTVQKCHLMQNKAACLFTGVDRIVSHVASYRGAELDVILLLGPIYG